MFLWGYRVEEARRFTLKLIIIRNVKRCSGNLSVIFHTCGIHTISNHESIGGFLLIGLSLNMKYETNLLAVSQLSSIPN